MKFKELTTATRLPFVTASVLPTILAITWCFYTTGEFHCGYALLCIIGVLLIHIGSNTINDFFDWNFSDGQNKNAGPFNGGSRNKLDGILNRSTFLIIALSCLAVLLTIALFFILHDRFFVLWFSLTALSLGGLYSIPPFRFHSRGLGEIVLFLAFGPALSAAVCYVITGTLRPDFFYIGIPGGLSTTAILWINQFPDYDADKAAGKNTLTVRIGLKNSRHIYTIIVLSIFISTASLLWYGIFPLLTVLLILLAPVCVKATRTLYTNYYNPAALEPAQKLTIQFQMLSTMLIIATIMIQKFFLT